MRVENTGVITFSIGVDWPDCDVDVVFEEIGYTFKRDPHEVSAPTPKGGSVEAVLSYLLMGEDIPLKEKYKKYQLKASETHSLMMGCCSIEYEVVMEQPEDFAMLPTIIKDCEEFVKEIFKEFTIYHQKGDNVSSSAVKIL